MRESVPTARYSPVCNVLRQWKTSLILTYRVYRLYDRTCTWHCQNFDSLHLLLSPSIKKTIASLVHTNVPHFLRICRMQYQTGGGDCGLFALATTCALCRGADPSTLSYL